MKPKELIERDLRGEEDSEDFTITHHGIKRMAQRLGLRRKSMARNVERALKYGMGIDDTRGKLRKYLITLSLRTLEYGKDPRILVYSGYIYIFASSTNTLITMWELPKTFVRHEKPYREIDPGDENVLEQEKNEAA
jgi:hypothetical protein